MSSSNPTIAKLQRCLNRIEAEASAAPSNSAMMDLLDLSLPLPGDSIQRHSKSKALSKINDTNLTFPSKPIRTREALTDMPQSEESAETWERSDNENSLSISKKEPSKVWYVGKKRSREPRDSEALQRLSEEEGS